MNIDQLLRALRAEAELWQQSQPAIRTPHASPWPPTVGTNPWADARLWAAHAPLNSSWLNLSIEEFVHASYWLCLGRPAEPEAQQYAKDCFNNGMPRAEWMLRLRLSPEAVSRLGWPWWRRVASVWLRLQTLTGQRLKRWQWGALRRAERWLSRQGERSLASLWLKVQSSQKLQWAELDQKVHQLAQDINRRFTLQPDELSFLNALEHQFRGDPQALSEQMAADYGKQVFLVTQSVGGPCLDVGCGRGAWLAWLNQQGITAKGVDMNPEGVAFAQAQGMDVQLKDGIEWLAEQPSASAAAITMFHLIEHLTLGQRLELMREAFRVLKPGGLLIMETPNPENLYVSMHTFYHDPTHTQPLTPDGLAFLCTYHGFNPPEVLRLHPYPDWARLPEVDAVTSRLNNMTCCGQDLGVLAYKPLPAQTIAA